MLCGMYLCVTFLYYQARTVPGAEVSLECPATFADNKNNPITCTVNKTAIDGVTCSSTPTLLGFSFKTPTEQSPTTRCTATYPCTSPAPVTTTEACGCTKQEGDIFTYFYLFKANKTTDNKGELNCQICEISTPALSRSLSESCKNIFFPTGYCETETLALRLDVLAQGGLVPHLTFALSFYVYMNYPFTGCWKNVAVLVGMMLAIVVVVILEAFAFSCACKNFPEVGPCQCMCLVVNVVAIINVVWVMIAGIIIIVRKHLLDLGFRLRCSLKNIAVVTVLLLLIVVAVTIIVLATRFVSKVSICYTTLVIVLLVLAQVVLALADSVAIYLYVCKNYPLTGCWKNIAVIVGFVLAVVMVVIFMVIASIYACKKFPDEDPCYCLCWVVIFVAVIDVIVVMITGIIISSHKGTCITECCQALCCAVTCLVGGIVCLCCKCTKDRRPPVTITSKHVGQEKDSYELTWKVPYTCKADIERFSVEYVQVEADTSHDPWTKRREIGERHTVFPAEKDRAIMITQLSSDTFYEVTITVVRKTDCSDGPPFVFKTAA